MFVLIVSTVLMISGLLLVMYAVIWAGARVIRWALDREDDYDAWRRE